MRKRQKLSRKASKRSFRKGAARIHGKNGQKAVMRGGIRL